MSRPPRCTTDSAFWQGLAERFAALRQEIIRQAQRPLAASYHSDGWGLEEFGLFRGRSAGDWLLDRATSEAHEEFKSVAGVCAVALGSPNTDQAWVEWLDCMRRQSIDFKAAEFSVSSLPREWRPDPDFEIATTGLLFEPVPVRPDPDVEAISTNIGEIDDVCGASERLCRRLADEALKFELVGAPTEVAEPRRSREPVSLAGADASKTMTLKEAVTHLRTSDDTLHRMRKKGEIDMFKVGSQWRVRASEVIRLRQEARFATR